MSKTNKKVYVVTRRGRRVESINYQTHAEANRRASALYAMLKEWDAGDADKVDILYTDKPNQIR